MSDFLGVPIEGEINHYNARSLPPQQDPQVLLDKIQAVLDHPLVESVKWRQYTPYFNDGDACTFGAWGTSAKIIGGDEDSGDYGDGFYSEFDLRYYEEVKNLPGVKDLEKLLKSLEDAIDGGAHDVVLQKTFGDPAEVIAREGGFEVEFYEHD